MSGPWKRTRSPEVQRGVALVAVLWVLVLLSVIATGLVRTARVETILARNTVDLLEAEGLADAGVHLAVAALMAQQGRNGEWATDGTPRRMDLSGGEVTISIQDQGGLVDLNTATAPLLRQVFFAAGLPDEEAAAAADVVLDWRDPDELVALNGAEDRDYFAAGYKYGAKDAPFDTVDELLRVYGMTPEIYRRVEPTLTVFSGRPGIDPSVAPREVLLSLPMFDEGMVDDLMAARETAARAGTATLQSLPTVQAQEYLAPSSRIAFSIVSTATTGAGARFSRLAVVTFPRSQATRYAFVVWRRTWPREVELENPAAPDAP